MLSEFIQRLYLESHVWFKSMNIKHPEMYRSTNIMFCKQSEFKIIDAIGLLKLLKIAITDEEYKYVEYFYNNYDTYVDSLHDEKKIENIIL